MGKLSKYIDKAVEGHVDRRQVTFLGEERPFMLGMYGLRRAREAGTDPIGALMRLVAAANSKGGTIEMDTAAMLDMAALLFAGFVTYDRELTLEQVESVMSFQEFMRVQEDLGDALKDLAVDAQEADEAPTANGTQKSTSSKKAPEPVEG